MAPFSSEAQRKFLWWKHPDIAKRWSGEMEKKHESQKNLPEYIENRKKALAHARKKMDK